METTPTTNTPATPIPAVNPAPIIPQPVPQAGSTFYDPNTGKPQGINQFDPNTGKPLTTPNTQNTNGAVGATPEQTNTINTAKTNLDAGNQGLVDAYNTFNNSVLSIKNGSMPLNAGQQAQISGLQSSYQTLIQQQQLQNTGAQGVANIRGYQTGAGEYDPSFQAKTIGTIVSAGIQKIADLNTQLASKTAELTTAFQKENISLIKDSYDAYVAMQDKRDAEFQKTINSTQAAIKDAQAQANWYQDQKIKEMTLQEKIKTDAFDAAYKMEDLQLKKQANTIASQINLPVVQMTSNGGVNKQSQTAFLNSLPGGANGAMATAVQGLSSYTINPNTFSSRVPSGQTQSQRQQLVTMAKQFDPTFDETQYNSRQALRTNFESGKYSQNINSLNTAIGHIANLESTFSKLGNRGFTPWNALANTTESMLGVGAITGAKTNLSAVMGELATTFKGTGATDQEIKNLGTIDSNSSPAQVKTFMETAGELLSSRLNTLTQTYESGMGKAPDNSFLNDNSAKALLGLKAQGLDLQIPSLDDTPAGQIYNIGTQNPSVQPTIIKMENDGLSSQAILDWINQNK